MDNGHTVRSLWDLGFFELFHPVMLIVLISIAYWYVKAVKAKEAHPSKSKTFFFMTGLLLFYIAEGSPLKAFGHHFLFSAHMFDMSICYFIVPPLVLGGMYGWMAAPIFNPRWLRRLLHVITHPLLAVTLFNFLISLYHIPVIFNTVTVHDVLMTAADVVLLIFAFVMWWLVVQPEEAGTRRLKPIEKVGYVFAASILLTPACALIMFSNHVVYDPVLHEPRVFEFFTPLQDQKAGGVVMKAIQEVVFIGALVYIFAGWAKADKDPEGNDLNPKSEWLANKPSQI